MLLTMLTAVGTGTALGLGFAASRTSGRRAGRLRVGIVIAGISAGVLMVLLLIALLSLAENDAEIVLTGPGLLVGGVAINIALAFAPAYVSIWEE